MKQVKRPYTTKEKIAYYDKERLMCGAIMDSLAHERDAYNLLIYKLAQNRYKFCLARLEQLEGSETYQDWSETVTKQIKRKKGA